MIRSYIENDFVYVELKNEHHSYLLSDQLWKEKRSLLGYDFSVEQNLWTKLARRLITMEYPKYWKEYPIPEECFDANDEPTEVYVTKQLNKMNNGKIKLFKADKGWGFITGDDNKDYFFHKSEMKDAVSQGESVTFDVVEGKRGVQAINIKRVK